MADIQKISISVTTEQLAVMKAAVDVGEYATVSEIVREAIRDWQHDRDLQQLEIARLRELIEEGEANGPAVPFDKDLVLQEARALPPARKARA